MAFWERPTPALADRRKSVGACDPTSLWQASPSLCGLPACAPACASPSLMLVRPRASPCPPSKRSREPWRLCRGFFVSPLDPTDLAKRLRALEKRVAAIEQILRPPPGHHVPGAKLPSFASGLWGAIRHLAMSGAVCCRSNAAPAGLPTSTDGELTAHAAPGQAPLRGGKAGRLIGAAPTPALR
jgi:hypothetical protein